ncbi:hypothetical protein OUZ56_025540 [Daphnia magna]|uniref:Uncharacterized protein n=1 Tax=Daphnia magna TaxID=35525 RepID=A0ABQ9ZK56_9CRUS|nr:hypothetical protein OUZ56_025540 [Daphnia magna]
MRKGHIKQGDEEDELRISVLTIILWQDLSAFISRILYRGRYGSPGAGEALWDTIAFECNISFTNRFNPCRLAPPGPCNNVKVEKIHRRITYRIPYSESSLCEDTKR